MKTSEVLEKALEWFGPNGENWVRGTSSKLNTGCSLIAIGKATYGCESELQTYLSARGMLHEAVGDNIVIWNDDSVKDFSEVKEGFIKAIQKAKELESNIAS